MDEYYHAQAESGDEVEEEDGENDSDEICLYSSDELFSSDGEEESDSDEDATELACKLKEHIAGMKLDTEIQNENSLWFTLTSTEGPARRLHRYPVLLDTASSTPFDENSQPAKPTQVLLFGESGVGKTTLFEFLKYPCLGADKRKPELNVLKESTSKSLESDTKSATLIRFHNGSIESNVHLCNGILISDLPGCADTRHVSELFRDKQVPNWLKQMAGMSEEDACLKENSSEIDSARSRQWVEALNFARMTAALQADVRAILFVIDPTTPRLTKEHKTVINFVCDLFGESATQMVKIVACRGTKAVEGQGKRREHNVDIYDTIEKATKEFAEDMGNTMKAKLKELGVGEVRYMTNLPLKYHFIDSQPDSPCELLRSLRQRDDLFDMLNKCKDVPIGDKKSFLRLPPDVLNQQKIQRNKFEEYLQNLKAKEGTPAAKCKELQQQILDIEKKGTTREEKVQLVRQGLSALNVDTASAITDKQNFTVKQNCSRMAFGKSTTVTNKSLFDKQHEKHKQQINGEATCSNVVFHVRKDDGTQGLDAQIHRISHEEVEQKDKDKFMQTEKMCGKACFTEDDCVAVVTLRNDTYLTRVTGTFHLTLPTKLKYEEDIKEKESEIGRYEEEAIDARSETTRLEEKVSGHEGELGDFAKERDEYKQRMGDFCRENFLNLNKFREMLKKDGCQLVDPLDPQEEEFNKIDQKMYIGAVERALGKKKALSKVIKGFQFKLKEGGRLSVRRLAVRLQNLQFLSKTEVEELAIKYATRMTSRAQFTLSGVTAYFSSVFNFKEKARKETGGQARRETGKTAGEAAAAAAVNQAEEEAAAEQAAATAAAAAAKKAEAEAAVLSLFNEEAEEKAKKEAEEAAKEAEETEGKVELVAQQEEAIRQTEIAKKQQAKLVAQQEEAKQQVELAKKQQQELAVQQEEAKQQAAAVAQQQTEMAEQLKEAKEVAAAEMAAMQQQLKEIKLQQAAVPPTSPTAPTVDLGGDLQQWQVPSSAIVIVRVLSHEGSFGDVHLVRWRGVSMAFKTIRTGGSEAARDAVRGALKEARALNEAKHENVIRLEGICIDDPQRMGVLMEYAEQGTLRHVLEANPDMADSQQRLLIRGILRGLVKLHSHTPTPILHGDLKATNVLVAQDGTPKLADFGLASGASSSLAGMNMSKTHRGGGTPVYSAPELFKHLFEEVSDSDDEDSEKAAGGTVSVYTMACDLYSAGILVWEVVTGENPWGKDVQKWSQDKTASQVEKKLAAKVLTKQKRPPVPDDCDPPLESIIKRLWHQDPAQRPPAQVVLGELEAHIDAVVHQEASASMAASIMADDYAVPDAPAYTLGDFASSNFKREYAWTATKPLEPAHTDRLLGAVRRVIEGYCTRKNIDQARGDTFFLELRREWELTDEVGIAAERLWTSAVELKTAGDGRDFEFCFIFSQLLREDPASLTRSCAIIARALNMNLVAGRTGSAVFPPNGECWRGGGFDEQHRGFFTAGKKYRVPGFLATATVKNVTNVFMFRAESCGFPVVQWCIRLDKRSDPRGENSLKHRCKHVNLLRVTHCAGEEEYLFAAFSVFTVREVVWSVNPTTQDPHCITVEAAIDNALDPEDLPLAPWS
jgi:hypothetical protein